MKRLLIYSLLALFVGVMGSCSKDEVIYKFEDGEIGCTFQASSLKYHELTEADNGVVKIPMYRANTKGTATVNVTITGGEGVFTPSATAFTFADGENVAWLNLAFDYESLSAKPSTIVFEMDDAENCAFTGISKTSVTLQRKLTWELVGTGYYYTDFFEEGWDQDVYKAQEGDFYLLPGCWFAGTDFSFFCDGTTVDWYASESGYNYGSYGPVVFGPTATEIEEVSGSYVMTVESDYILSEFMGGYILYQGFEQFTFPEGFSF